MDIGLGLNCGAIFCNIFPSQFLSNSSYQLDPETQQDIPK